MTTFYPWLTFLFLHLATAFLLTALSVLISPHVWLSILHHPRNNCRGGESLIEVFSWKDLDSCSKAIMAILFDLGVANLSNHVGYI